MDLRKMSTRVERPEGAEQFVWLWGPLDQNMHHARNAYDAHDVLCNTVPVLGGGGGGASSQLGI